MLSDTPLSAEACEMRDMDTTVRQISSQRPVLSLSKLNALFDIISLAIPLVVNLSKGSTDRIRKQYSSHKKGRVRTIDVAILGLLKGGLTKGKPSSSHLSLELVVHTDIKPSSRISVIKKPIFLAPILIDILLSQVDH